MTWFVMAVGVKDGTQIVAVDAPNKRDAFLYGAEQVRKQHKLPKSYTLMPRGLTECDTEDEAQSFIDRLHKIIEQEESIEHADGHTDR